MPANTLPSVCWAARPTITAVKADAASRVSGFEPRDRQREEQDAIARNEADEEAHRPGGGRVHAAEEQRADGAAERPSDRPAEDQQQR